MPILTGIAPSIGLECTAADPITLGNAVHMQEKLIDEITAVAPAFV